MIVNQRRRIDRGTLLLVFILSVVILYAATNLSPGVKETAPTAVDGIFRLDDWNLKENGKVQLAGEWAFYWRQLLLPGETVHYAYDAVTVPNAWNRYVLDGNPLSGHGYATYRLKVVMDTMPDGLLGIKVPKIPTSYKIWIDGHSIAEGGVAASTKEDEVAAFLPQTAIFMPESTTFEIVVQVSNYSLDHGGMLRPFELGDGVEMSRQRERELSVVMFLLGSVLMLSLYSIYCCFVNRNNRAMLYFSILCLFAATRILLIEQMFIMQILPELRIHHILFLDYLSLYGGFIFTVLYVHQMYPIEFRATANLIFAWIGGALVATITLMPVQIYTRLAPLFNGYVAIACCYIAYVLIVAASRRREGTMLRLIGSFVNLLALAHDALLMFNIPALFNREILYYCLFVLLYIEAGEFARRKLGMSAIRRQIRELMELRRSTNDATEIALLQAEIKPHFLYNTLNTILSVSLDEPGKAHELLLKLSHYLQNSFQFNESNNYVGLSQELELVKSYLFIEKARYGHRLRVVFDVDESLNIAIPPLIIQPIVENAVKHGVTRRKEGGTVKITIRAEDDYLVIVVEDDGIGIARSRMEGIFKGTNGRKNGIALMNINRRLLLSFGQGLIIESDSGIGTKVTIRIPEPDAEYVHLRGT